MSHSYKSSGSARIRCSCSGRCARTPQPRGAARATSAARPRPALSPPSSPGTPLAPSCPRTLAPAFLLLEPLPTLPAAPSMPPSRGCSEVGPAPLSQWPPISFLAFLRPQRVFVSLTVCCIQSLIVLTQGTRPQQGRGGQGRRGGRTSAEGLATAGRCHGHLVLSPRPREGPCRPDRSAWARAREGQVRRPVESCPRAGAAWGPDASSVGAFRWGLDPGLDAAVGSRGAPGPGQTPGKGNPRPTSSCSHHPSCPWQLRVFLSPWTVRLHISQKRSHTRVGHGVRLLSYSAMFLKLTCALARVGTLFLFMAT